MACAACQHRLSQHNPLDATLMSVYGPNSPNSGEHSCLLLEGGIIVLGFFLMIGNLTGAFVTSPMAGVTMFGFLVLSVDYDIRLHIDTS